MFPRPRSFEGDWRYLCENGHEYITSCLSLLVELFPLEGRIQEKLPPTRIRGLFMFAIPNPLVLKIHEYYFLESLLKEFPSMLKDWREKELRLISDDVLIAADGDNIIEKNLYSQYSNCIYEQTDFEEQLFSQALFMMIYSYYESILHKMAVDNDVQDRPSAICHKKGLVLSETAAAAVETIFCEAKVLRNYLCHNNAGTESKQDAEETRRVLAILEEKGAISMNITRCENGQIDLSRSQIYSVNTSYTLEILKKEYLVLKELAMVCGYTNHV